MLNVRSLIKIAGALQLDLDSKSFPKNGGQRS